ncbi:TPA: GntR family transcriptional regulator [Enterococcus faecalis]
MLSSKAYQCFIQDITEGNFPKGFHVIDSELAKRYGMSRTPVRSAIQQLEREGVLQRYGKSLIVQDLDLNEIELNQFVMIRREFYNFTINYLDMSKLKKNAPLISESCEGLTIDSEKAFPLKKLICIDQLYFQSMTNELNYQDLIYTLNRYLYYNVPKDKISILNDEIYRLKNFFNSLINESKRIKTNI